MGPLLQTTRSVPIVFPAVADPVGAGFVDSLARPGGNVTGFMSFEYGLGGKWLELLKEIAPKVTRAAILRDSAIASGIGQFGVIQAMAPSLRVEVIQVNLRQTGEIGRAVEALARAANGGLIVTAIPLSDANRDLIATLAAHHKLPAVYYARSFVVAGGLISYGPDFVDQFRRSAEYVDRILKGEKPADLPVQAPTKFELVINLKTAKALGLDVPPTLARPRRRGDRVMKRREFITLLGGAARRGRSRRAAQQATLPVIGFLNTASPEAFAHLVAAFRRGLNKTGYVDGENVLIEYRWARGHYDQVPELAGQLVVRGVNVLAAFSPPAALAAKAATASIPIVIVSGDDPVKLGLIASLNRPSGNVTGVSLFTVALGAKRHELLHDLMPAATAIGVLVNPDSPNAEPDIEDARRAARVLGWQIAVVTATTEREFDAAFAKLLDQRVAALVVGNDQFFNSRRERIVTLAERQSLPTIYPLRDFTAAGGLMSYGPSISEAYREAGVYAGRILKGEKPSDLPVLQPTKFELVINLKIAKALGLEIPPTLLARADEVIE